MKKLLIFQEMKLFNLKLKNSCFLGESFTVFHHCFFGCFQFFMFLFLDVFISSDVFGEFHCWLHLFTSLFLHCFFTIDVTAIATLRRFLLNTPFLLLPRLPWGWQFCLKVPDFPLRLETQTQPISLFESHSAQQLYDK